MCFCVETTDVFFFCFVLSSKKGWASMNASEILFFHPCRKSEFDRKIGFEEYKENFYIVPFSSVHEMSFNDSFTMNGHVLP